MSRCSSCGTSIPDGQDICSMCYGDIDHGGDGIYRQWLEAQYEREYLQKLEEARAFELMIETEYLAETLKYEAIAAYLGDFVGGVNELYTDE